MGCISSDNRAIFHQKGFFAPVFSHYFDARWLKTPPSSATSRIKPDHGRRPEHVEIRAARRSGSCSNRDRRVFAGPGAGLDQCGRDRGRLDRLFRQQPQGMLGGVGAEIHGRTWTSGKPKEVTRGDIRLYIAYRPGQAGEVSFSGGYPFAPDSAVEVNIGGNVFKLFTEGESAWTGSPSEDSKLISALRAGSSAVMTGRSARGTVTKDTFSLSGITADDQQGAGRLQISRIRRIDG
jgi:hypothetical protein